MKCCYDRPDWVRRTTERLDGESLPGAILRLEHRYGTGGVADVRRHGADRWSYAVSSDVAEVVHDAECGGQ